MNKIVELNQKEIAVVTGSGWCSAFGGAFGTFVGIFFAIAGDFTVIGENWAINILSRNNPLSRAEVADIVRISHRDMFFKVSICATIGWGAGYGIGYVVGDLIGGGLGYLIKKL